MTEGSVHQFGRRASDRIESNDPAVEQVPLSPGEPLEKVFELHTNEPDTSEPDVPRVAPPLTRVKRRGEGRKPPWQLAAVTAVVGALVLAPSWLPAVGHALGTLLNR